MTNLTYETQEADYKESYTQHIAVGVAILSFFVAAAASPFTGLGVALYFIHRHVDKDKLRSEKQQREKLVQASQAAYKEQLRSNFAALPPGEMPPIPKNLSWRDGSLAQYIEAWEETLSSRQQSGTAQTIGVNTKLGAIAVPSVAASPVKTETNTETIATSLAVKLQSTLIVGQPGAGKGLLLAMALREVKRLHPDVQIWAIDPKVAQSEAWRWEVCDRYLPIKIPAFCSPEAIKDITRVCDEFVREFADIDAPKLLVFDEALAVREKAPTWFKGLMAGFNALCSMGRESRSYGWLVSQSPNTDDFGISGGVRNVYRRILILDKSNLGLLDNGSTFFNGKPSPELLHQTGRAYFDSTVNHWGSVPNWQDVARSPVVSVAHPVAEPRPEGESRRLELERALALPTVERGDDLFDDDDIDPAIELISEIQDRDKRDALMLAYQWATKRLADGKEIDKNSFANRAKNERKCLYLKDNKDAIWMELSGLIF
jgi:hypothetical protein